VQNLMEISIVTLQSLNRINKITTKTFLERLAICKYFLKKRFKQKNGGYMYFGIYNCARKGALFVPLWETRYLLFFVSPCTVGICLLLKHILKKLPLDY
jgi:hypothetical protein